MYGSHLMNSANIASAKDKPIFNITFYSIDQRLSNAIRNSARIALGKAVIAFFYWLTLSFYILDEPTTGLHFDDVRQLLEVLQRLVDAGNTVLVIEHNLDIIKAADYVIDLGPEGGDRGGTIVAQGTPEQIAQVPESHTGRFLARIL